MAKPAKLGRQTHTHNNAFLITSMTTIQIRIMFKLGVICFYTNVRTWNLKLALFRDIVKLQCKRRSSFYKLGPDLIG